MLLDQLSILIAIGFSSASLGLTLFMMWIVGRGEAHLLSWSLALAFILLGVAFFGSVVENYNATFLLVSFLLLVVGFGLLYIGSATFCSGKAGWLSAMALVGLGGISITAAFALGYSGIGTMAGNVLLGALMLANAHQYWSARAESPLLMTANAALYLIVSVSFMLCGYALIHEGQYILTAKPSNWAEDINSIVVIAGLTGIGTLSLTLNQARIANRHKREAMTDALTGLLNRRALLQNPSNTVPAGTALVAMDLDYFKKINDRYGHDCGDQALKAFAELIRANIRPTDLAARMGGEEFCIVVSDSNQRAPMTIAERIREQVEAMTISTAAGPVRTTVSAGISYASGDETLQSLLIRADEALYEAKSEGRNRVRTSDLNGLAA
ncbi:MAG: GGDEF domain-containing protein [Rhizobiales bacterium]|nr:GGDEF domain-containing protein [Hyphomicrobiales bacterium]